MGQKPQLGVGTTIAALEATQTVRPTSGLQPIPDVPSAIPSRSTASTIETMSAVLPEGEMSQPAPDLRLVVELPSRPRVFFGNLRDLIFPRRQPRLELRSAPAPFWHDVFVKRPLPWCGFFQSVACHLIAFAILLGATRFLALQPQVVPQPAFDHSQVIYYSPSEYLPPIDTRNIDTRSEDTRTEQAAEPRKADPEVAQQPIISLPREVDNRSQTIVTPANIKLKRDVAIPNIVSWSDQTVKPQLEIPPVPLTPAAEKSRLAPEMNAVVAPPPDIRASRLAATFNAPEPALIAPPPSVQTTHTRSLGDLNIGHSAVINPAPQLAVSEQRAIPGGRSSAVTGVAPQIVAPPSSLSASASSGTPGRVIALNLHPAVGAPPDPPQGNRRGAFAATPEGHAGASGSPGSARGSLSSGSSSGGSSSASGTASGNGNATGSGGKKAGDVPTGLYVGSAPAKTSSVAGNRGPSVNQASPNLTASVHPPRVTNTRPMQPGNYEALTEPERAVFAGRKFYSLTLNLPNLNSAGGSWIIRFAEVQNDGDNHHGAEAAAADDLSQPTATHKVDPGYPIQLMRENVAGTVILYAVIHADGTLGNVRVLRGVDDRLDRSASAALAQWQFQPATKNGMPVDVEATFQIPFKPARMGSNF
jgi:TonB family protein